MDQPPRRRSPRGSGAELRGEIVDAALALLEESADEAAVTLRGVARRAGIAAPSIYDHFGGLQEVVAAAVTQAFANFEKAMAVGTAPGLSPVQGLRAALSAYLAWAEANPGTYRGIASLRPANPKFAWPAAEDLVDGIMRRAGALPS